MTDHDDADDGIEAALRLWGDEHRARAAATAPPAPVIADLLAGRRRRHGAAAVAASVVLVAALATGLGFGLAGRDRNASPASPGHLSRSPAVTGTATGTAHRPCWQQFADAGSRFRGFTGIVVLRYTGTTACRVFEQPQLALVDAHGKVVGPHAPTATLNRFTVVEPGDTVRATVAIERLCLAATPKDGRFSLLVGFRPRSHPRPAADIVVPVGTLRFIQDAGCPMGTAVLSAATAASLQVVAPNRTSTLADLTRIARREAAEDGDPSATAEAVRTTYGPAEGAIGDGESRQPSPTTPVWVVQLHGAFVCNLCRGPIGSSAPRGDTVVLVLLEPSLRFSDLTVGSQHHDLSKLGTVVPLIP